MWALLLLGLSAHGADLQGVPEGLRIAPMDAGTGVGVRQHVVVGADGGTSLTELRARYALDGLRFGMSIPFAAYRTPVGRTVGLGNVQLEAWYLLDDDDSPMGVGLEVHLGLAAPAWTWANDGRQVWPGGGADVVLQGRTAGALSYLYRLSFGLHGARAYEPFPGVYARLGAAGGVDWSFAERFGLTGEAAFTYWDPSPFEVTGLFRAAIVPGLQARVGFVFPLAVWMGATPADQPAGIRETTLLIDLQMTM